jgi:tetratricopeptide (TPR) repeat protein
MNILSGEAKIREKEQGLRVACLRLMFLGLCLLWVHARGYSSTTHVQRALELLNRGDLAAAESEARLALHNPENRAVAWAMLGTIRLRQNQYEEGADFLRKALRLDPRLTGARVSLGGAYLLQGRKDQARDTFRKALELDPTNANARLDLAELESEAGNYKVSLETAKVISDALRRSPQGVLLLAQDYTGLQERDAVRGLLPDWEALSDPPADSSTNFAALLIKNGLTREAAAVLEKAKRSGHVSYSLYFMLADCYFSTGNRRQASENYEAALGLKADCVVCLERLAALARREGNSEKALAYLVQARRAEPDNPEVLFELGKLCLERDLLEDALPALQKAAAMSPENDSYSYLLGSAYIGKGTYKPAVLVFRRLVAKHPSDAAVNYALGCALYLDQDFDQADRYLSESLRLQPRQRAASYYLGLVADKKNDSVRAFRILSELVARHPDFVQAHEALGTLLVKARQYPQAKDQLDTAIRLDPNSLQAHYQLGILLGRTGKQEESQREIELARSIEGEQRAHKSAQIRLLLPE